MVLFILFRVSIYTRTVILFFQKRFWQYSFVCLIFMFETFLKCCVLCIFTPWKLSLNICIFIIYMYTWIFTIHEFTRCNKSACAFELGSDVGFSKSKRWSPTFHLIFGQDSKWTSFLTWNLWLYIYFFLLDVYTFWEDCSIYTFRQNVSRWWFKHCFFQPKPWVNGPICLSNRCCGWTSEPFSWPRSFVHVGNYDTKMVGKNIASNFRVNQGTVGCTPDRVQWTHYIIFIYIYICIFIVFARNFWGL